MMRLALMICVFAVGGQAGTLDWSRVLDPGEVRALHRVFQFLQRTSDSSMYCNGRLTLTSGTAVTSSNVTAATTVYFTPYNGDRISVYNGTYWDLLSFTEKSIAVPSTTTTPFDIFGYSNSGTLALEVVDWSNGTTRATALATQDGVLVKSGATTRRYLGTARTTSVSGQTEDSTSSRLVWNMCNRLPRKLLAQSGTDSWTYNTAAWRAVNANTTLGQTRVEYVIGVPREPVRLAVQSGSANHSSTSTAFPEGIGINSTTANSADLFAGMATTFTANAHNALYNSVPSTGYSYAQWIENSVASGTSTRYTSSANARQGGMVGEVWQ